MDSEYALVKTDSGQVRGKWRDGTSCAFLGVPFAQPPVGDLMFAAPQPVKAWEGVRDALEMGPTPLRKDDPNSLIPEPAVEGQETLNLNVYTPSPGDVGAALPVLVWIHGGGFTGGSQAGSWYDGATFNRDDVVVVTVSYRLGFVGFGFVEGAPQNRGVLDWLAALEWVRDNIAAFGGDPSRVTIAGQSAGGGAVLTLLGMESAQSLFHGAMSISGALADISVEDAKKISAKVGVELGVPAVKGALEKIPESRILEAQEKVSAPKGLSDLRSVFSGDLPWGPVVDGEVVKQPTLQAIAAGVGADKPLLLGATDDEFSMVFTDKEKVTKWIPALAALRLAGVKGAAARAYIDANKSVAEGGTGRLLGRLLTDKIFRSLVLRVAMLRGGGSAGRSGGGTAAHGGGSSAGRSGGPSTGHGGSPSTARRGVAPTWVYQFLYRQPSTDLAIHCLDVPFWFDCLDSERVENLAGANPPQDLATEMHGDAVRFVRDGDPGWSPWTDSVGEVEVLGAGKPGLTRLGGYDEVRALLR